MVVRKVPGCEMLVISREFTALVKKARTLSDSLITTYLYFTKKISLHSTFITVINIYVYTYILHDTLLVIVKIYFTIVTLLFLIIYIILITYNTDIL